MSVKWRWSECKEEYTAIMNGMIIALLLVIIILVVGYTLDLNTAYQQCVKNLSATKTTPKINLTA